MHNIEPPSLHDGASVPPLHPAPEATNSSKGRGDWTAADNLTGTPLADH